MREPQDWDEDYILTQLPIGESNWLEFKGRKEIDLTLSSIKAEHVTQNLSVTLSAMANTGGGYLVYGIKDPKPNQPLEVDDGGIDLFVKKNGTREWLEDIIPNLADPPLTGFNVYQLKASQDDSQIAQGRGIFIVHIKDSFQAPHQAYDNKYYGRIAGKSKPLPDRFVRDIMGRRQHPKINLKFSLVSREFYSSSETEGEFSPLSLGLSAPSTYTTRTSSLRWKLEIRAENVGKVYANYVNVFVWIPDEIIPSLFAFREIERREETETRDNHEYVSRGYENVDRDYIGLRNGLNHEYGSARFSPILPSLAHVWTEELVDDINFDNLSNDLNIYWEAFADNALPQEGKVLLSEVERIFKKEYEE
ncbi:MAG: ATP-binding protein [Anaerolineae bacterium]|nr:ATP-binding protein [Anaerolineae bacterium]